MLQSAVRKTFCIALVAMAVLAGCEKQGPAERTGEAIDDAARKTGEQIEEAGEKIKDCVDNVPENC